jgi:hypothetical protein
MLLSVLSSPVPVLVSAEMPVMMYKTDLHRKFLLQISYVQAMGWPDFLNSRSRVVLFERQKRTLRMIEAPRDSATSSRVLATFPILEESDHSFIVDFNAGLSKISGEEDRTGEDYYGRENLPNDSFFRLLQHKMLSVTRNGPMLVLEQEGLTQDNERVLVYYYLSPYRPDPQFKPFEIKNLDRFGFYETYPQRQGGRTVLYAMKFGTPIVFALSSEIPEPYRQAVRDGVLYWNKAFGVSILHVIDAPEGVFAPNPDYNVIQWVPDGAYSSTAHIQGDPLTGEILHAQIFLRSGTVSEGGLDDQRNHLRYVVAHEVGHALGLRHNFAEGPASTVMNYFDYDATLRIGRDVVLSGDHALEYDRQVIRHVYLGEPLELDKLPAFCTDSQPGCNPFKSRIRLGSSHAPKPE